jgi:hypothetical protein
MYCKCPAPPAPLPAARLAGRWQPRSSGCDGAPRLRPIRSILLLLLAAAAAALASCCCFFIDTHKSYGLVGVHNQPVPAAARCERHQPLLISSKLSWLAAYM